MNKTARLSAAFNEAYSNLQFDYAPATLYDPIRHILGIPGKRLRPLFLLLANDAFGGSSEDAMPAALAIELFHNFTLMHDDIMDNASIRRGMPTVHIQYGVNSGILSGDAMMIYAYRFLCSSRAELLPDLLRCFNQTAIEVCEGQQLDVDFEQRTDVSISEYLQMIKYKTSVLLACSLKMGAILAGADEQAQNELYNFGINIGLSFQIKDDWLDTFGEEKKVGKKIGGDILQNKKTYLLVSAMQTDEDALTAALPILAMQKNDEKIAAMLHLYERYQLSEKTLTAAERYYQDALQNLQHLRLPDAQKAIFFELAERIHQRSF